MVGHLLLLGLGPEPFISFKLVNQSIELLLWLLVVVKQVDFQCGSGRFWAQSDEKKKCGHMWPRPP